MTRLLPLLLLFSLAWSARVAAQSTAVASEHARLEQRTAATGKTSREFVPLHVSDRLRALPESRQALAELEQRRLSGTPDVANKTAADPVGTTRDFRVYNFRTRSQQTINFTLKVDESRFLLWVQTTELSRVTDADVERLRVALAESTPAGSINPNAGIIVNDEAVFGAPPNVDGDGKTDILLVDIQDDFDPNTNPSAVTGFFFPSDLGSPVRKDILYLDTYPTFEFSEEEMLITAAHEYQHLIHAGADPLETSFVNEGLSEWASTMNGYPPRAVDYLLDLDLQRNTLVDWPPPPDFGADQDYQRAGLFTTYVVERMGTAAVKDLVRSRLTGEDGFAAVLAGLGISLRDVVASFSAANFVNDARLGDPYGYATGRYASVRARARFEVDGLATNALTPGVQGPLARGGVDYYSLRSVGDLTLTIDAPDGTSNPTPVRTLIRPTVVLRRSDGSSEVRPLTLAGQAFQFDGSFIEVVIVVPYADLNGSSTFLNYELSATWQTAAGGVRREDVVLDDGHIVYDAARNSAEVYFFHPGGSSSWEADSRAATRFDVPAGASLASVSTAHLYAPSGSSTLSSVPPTGAVDYLIELWPDNGSGEPGTSPFFSLVRQDIRSQLFDIVGNRVRMIFDTVDLTPLKDQIGPLPETIFVSIANAGSDTNYLVMPVSAFDTTAGGPSPSFWYMHFSSGATEWGAFASLQSLSSGVRPFAKRVAPIRASFLVPVSTAAEVARDLPERISLEPNYPNPFNPATRLAFSLDAAQDVRLSVFDVLGREVRVLHDGPAAAGRHEVRFDAAQLPSGLYLYRLVARSGTLTRTMVLVR